jgi:hypothetical protein
MFVYKTQAEIDAMTSKELGEYLTAKNEHEIALRKEEMRLAIETATKNNVSKEDIEAIEKRINEQILITEKQLLQLKALEEKGMGTKIQKSDLIEFIEREKDKNKTSGMESVVVKVAALMTTANILPNVSNGFNQLFGNYIDPTIYHAPKDTPFIMSLVDTQTAPGTENIWYVERVNEDGDAAFIAEGVLKPLIDGDYQERKAPVVEAAARWKMSRRLINHAPSVVADFKMHADELMALIMEDGVLNGTGLSNQPSGLVTLASPFVVPSALANFYEDANIWDVIIAVATYVRLNNHKGNLTCILNTVWEAKMKGYKNLDGDYIIPPFVTQDGKKVGAVTVQFENQMDEDAILLGDLKKFKVRVCENIQYFEGYENDDFSKNLESRKLEAFYGTYLPTSDAGAIIYDDIATILTAISAT